MSVAQTISGAIEKSPLVAVVLYVAIVGGLLVTVGLALLDLLDRRRMLTETSSLLAQLENSGARGGAGGSSASNRPGTPYLEGPTVTVAGAALLQRVAGAVTAVGGSVQSSQVDVVGTEAKNGFVGLVVSCEMEQPALQKLLYDLEAGMPFLFVDQLDVQVPQTTSMSDTGTGRIRVVLGVSGQWQGGK